MALITIPIPIVTPKREQLSSRNSISHVVVNTGIVQSFRGDSKSAVVDSTLLCH